MANNVDTGAAQDSSPDFELALQQHQQLQRHRQHVAGLVAASSVLGLLALTAPFVLSRSPLPYMATPGTKVRKALQHVRATFDAQAFCDLGSGDGHTVRHAVRVGYRRAVGVERNTTLYLLSQMWRLARWNRGERQSSQFVHGDLFAYNVQPFDTILLFGVPALMLPVSRKLARECRPGTCILSYRFRLPLAQDDTDQSGLVRGCVVYNEQNMRIYQVLAVRDHETTKRSSRT